MYCLSSAPRQELCGPQSDNDRKGLTLEPAAEKDTWKRLGLCRGDATLLKIYHSLSAATVPVKALPQSSTSKSSQESIMLWLEGAKIEILTLV
jgi:hypothetical protein